MWQKSFNASAIMAITAHTGNYLLSPWSCYSLSLSLSLLSLFVWNGRLLLDSHNMHTCLSVLVTSNKHPTNEYRNTACLPARPSVRPSVRPSARLPACPPARLPACLPACLSISVYPSLCSTATHLFDFRLGRCVAEDSGKWCDDCVSF